MDRRPAVLQAGIEDPAGAEPVEPRTIGNERRLVHMARDPHRRLVALDPLHQFDVAEKPFATPARRRIRRRRVMNPNPSLWPNRRGLAKLVVDTRFDQRAIPPRTDREERVADREVVAIAGDAEFAHLADPAGYLLAFRAAFVEVVIARAQNDAGEA